MTLSRRKAIGVLAGVPALALLDQVKPAYALLPAVHDATGAWLGLYQSGVTATSGYVALRIGEQKVNAFSGIAGFGELPPGPCRGTYAPSGEFILNGDTARGGSPFQLHGASTGFADGSVRVVGAYQRPTLRDAGGFALIKLLSPGPCRAIGGSYSGRIKFEDGSLMPVALTLVQDSLEGGRGLGPGFRGAGNLGDAQLRLAGGIRPLQPGAPPDPCHIVGAGRGVRFFCDGSVFQGDNGLPAVQGVASVQMGDGSVRKGDLLLLPAVQR